MGVLGHPYLIESTNSLYICVYVKISPADVQSEEEEPDADELIAAALSEARGQEGTYPNPHKPGPIDPQVHVSICCILT